MRKQNTFFKRFLKGSAVGFGTIIPGLSGGTVAMAAGIFEEIMECLSNIFKDTKQSTSTIFPYICGFVSGFIILIYPLKAFSYNFPVISKLVFCGITIIGVTFFVRKNLVVQWNTKMFFGLFLGSFNAFIISTILLSSNINIDAENTFLLMLIGLLLALALVLPAISFTYLLVYLGLYDRTLDAIISFDISFLLPLGLGIIGGTLLFSKLFVTVLSKNKNETYAVILGFIIISLSDTLIGLKC